MAKKRKKRPIKLTNKFERFFFKYKYYIFAIFLLLNLWNPNYLVNLEVSNSLISWCVLSTTIIILIIVFFFMPTYRKVYTSGDILGIALIFMLVSALALKNTILRINGSIGMQEKICMNGTF